MATQFDERWVSLQINAGANQNIAPQPTRIFLWAEFETNFAHKLAWKSVGNFYHHLPRKMSVRFLPSFTRKIYLQKHRHFDNVKPHQITDTF